MRLFLSYRRDDSPFVAGRLKERMMEAFGEENVFYDVDSVGPGDDFRAAIAERLNAADAVLAVIGPQWNPSRLLSETDFVRIELEQTLLAGKRLIPILIAPAQMPTPAQLPESLKNLAFRNGLPLRPDPDFDTDVSRLLKGLTSTDRDRRHWFRSNPARAAMLAGGFIAAVVLLVVVTLALINRGDEPTDDDGDAALTTVTATTDPPTSAAPTAVAAAADWGGDSLQSGLEAQRWTEREEPATTVEWGSNGVTISVSSSSAANAQGWIQTACTFPSDFAVSVTYELVQWNASRGHRLGLLAIVDETQKTMLALQRNSDGAQDHYLIDFGSDGRFTDPNDRRATVAISGELRLIRQAGEYMAQVRDYGASEWSDLGSGKAGFTEPVPIGISVWSSVEGATLEVRFRDFVVESGTCES